MICQWSSETMNLQPRAWRPGSRRLRGAPGGAVMAVTSMSCVQLGLALSVHLFGQLGPVGVAGAAAGLGRKVLPAPAIPAPPARLHRPGPAGVRRARRGDGRPDAAVHARRRTPAARPRQRAGVPRSAERCNVWFRARALALDRPGRPRRRPADQLPERRHQPRFGSGFRPRCRALLGRVHPADPAAGRPAALGRIERTGRAPMPVAGDVVASARGLPLASLAG